MARSPLYVLWRNILERCHNPRHPYYSYYGARGIRVADEWRADFVTFADHIGLRPSPTHTLDRIDNARGYAPGNVRWATQAEQLRNTRRNIQILAFGETRCAADWVSWKHVPAKTIVWRIRHGWAPERAITEPPRQLIHHGLGRSGS
jgi:hypothetical protein